MVNVVFRVMSGVNVGRHNLVPSTTERFSAGVQCGAREDSSCQNLHTAALHDRISENTTMFTTEENATRDQEKTRFFPKNEESNKSAG